MLKPSFVFIVLLLFCARSYAQQEVRYSPYRLIGRVAIGKESGVNPDESAILDVGGANAVGGILAPRGYRDDITNPKPGLIFYDTELQAFVFREGNTWSYLGGGYNVGYGLDQDGFTFILDSNAVKALLSWGNVAGKPIEFPPESHTHPMSQVEGLNAALSNKLDHIDTIGKWISSGWFTSLMQYADTAGMLAAYTRLSVFLEVIQDLQLSIDSAITVGDTAAMLAGYLRISPFLDSAAALRSAIDAKQNQLNGTGLVRMSGTAVAYDNTPYTPEVRTITINGNTQSLAANRAWEILPTDTSALRKDIDKIRDTLGTAAYQNIGTSGANVPLLSANNTHSGTITFSNSVTTSSRVVLGGNVGFTIGQDYDEFGGGTGFTHLRLNVTGDYYLGGWSSASYGQVITVTNIGTGTLSVLNEHGAATAAQRFRVGDTLFIRPQQTYSFFYDGNIQRWRLLSPFPAIPDVSNVVRWPDTGSYIQTSYGTDTAKNNIRIEIANIPPPPVESVNGQVGAIILQFMDTALVRNDSVFGMKNGSEFFILKVPLPTDTLSLSARINQKATRGSSVSTVDPGYVVLGSTNNQVSLAAGGVIYIHLQAGNVILQNGQATARGNSTSAGKAFSVQAANLAERFYVGNNGDVAAINLSGTGTGVVTANSGGTLTISRPPPSGTFILTSTDGVLSWEPAP